MECELKGRERRGRGWKETGAAQDRGSYKERERTEEGRGKKVGRYRGQKR